MFQEKAVKFVHKKNNLCNKKGEEKNSAFSTPTTPYCTSIKWFTLTLRSHTIYFTQTKIQRKKQNGHVVTLIQGFTKKQATGGVPLSMLSEFASYCLNPYSALTFTPTLIKGRDYHRLI